MTDRLVSVNKLRTLLEVGIGYGTVQAGLLVFAAPHKSRFLKYDNPDSQQGSARQYAHRLWSLVADLRSSGPAGTPSKDSYVCLGAKFKQAGRASLSASCQASQLS